MSITQKLYDSGEAAVVGTVNLSGTTLGTADNVLAVADYNHYRFDSGTLIGMSSGILNGSSANGPIYCLIRPTLNMNMDLLITGSADFTFKFLDTPTVSGSGTAITPRSYNRRFSPDVCATFYVSAALATTGVTVYDK